MISRLFFVSLFASLISFSPLAAQIEQESRRIGGEIEGLVAPFVVLEAHGITPLRQHEPIDEYFNTDLHRRAREVRGASHIRTIILVHKYEVDPVNLMGNTPLAEACDAGILDNVVWLLHLGANIDKRGPITSPLLQRFFEYFFSYYESYSRDESIDLAYRAACTAGTSIQPVEAEEE